MPSADWWRDRRQQSISRLFSLNISMSGWWLLLLVSIFRNAKGTGANPPDLTFHIISRTESYASMSHDRSSSGYLFNTVLILKISPAVPVSEAVRSDPLPLPCYGGPYPSIVLRANGNCMAMKLYTLDMTKLHIAKELLYPKRMLLFTKISIIFNEL